MSQDRTRGLQPDDDSVFCAKEVEKLRTAQQELCFLLTRGYPVKSAMTFVGNHHQLTVRQALAVTRASSSLQSLYNRNSKRLSPENIKGQTVYIDGFNLIITLEVALSDGVLIVGQDGCVRDLAELRGSYRLIPQTQGAIELIRDGLASLNASRAVIFLDRPVSNSGRLLGKLYETEWPLPFEVEIVDSPDALLKKLSCVVTGDAIILDEAQSWFNMTEYILIRSGLSKRLTRIIRLDVKQDA